MRSSPLPVRILAPGADSLYLLQMQNGAMEWEAVRKVLPEITNTSIPNSYSVHWICHAYCQLEGSHCSLACVAAQGQPSFSSGSSCTDHSVSLCVSVCTHIMCFVNMQRPEVDVTCLPPSSPPCLLNHKLSLNFSNHQFS